jgi:uncharacterized membrane protein
VYKSNVRSGVNSRIKNYILIASLSVFILVGLLLVSLPLWGVFLGLDIHFRDHYFVLPLISTALFLSLVAGAVWFLFVLIRREIRRKWTS